jgi:nucleotide-binding universal stress UspA family protein
VSTPCAGGKEAFNMYKKMLVLLDGSELAEVVFRYARELSGRLDIDLDLLHVVTPQEEDQLPMRRAYIERMAKVLCDEAQGLSTSTSPADVEKCIEAKGTVAIGDPADEIIKYIDENGVDLVMLSTRGKSGFKVWNIGSVATQVIHASKVPVWLVPAELRDEILEDTLPKRPLLVPLNGSEVSEAAIPHAVALSRQRGAAGEMILVHVAEYPTTFYTADHLKAAEVDRDKIKAYLEGVAEPLRAQGLNVRTEVLIGDPATAVLQYIRHNPPQLVAMATRGRRGLSRFVFGSVTEEIMHSLKKTPMLLVPAVAEED